MPRAKRVEFEDALYHISAHGNRGLPIVEDDIDRERFFETLSETVDQTGWEVYAWALLENHYHLVIRTPEPNLVQGMTWFQNAITKRQNARHKQQGHLFAGRYKAVLLEENYLKTVIHYVHLAPVRAQLISAEQEAMINCAWSSTGDYLLPEKKRRGFSSISTALKTMKFSNTEKGREQFLQETSKISGTEEAEYKRNIRSGWVMGAEEFHEEILYQLRRSGQDSHIARRHRLNEELAQELIASGLAKHKLEQDDLLTLRKNDRRKVEIALQIRAKTTMNADWIGKHLHMGTRGSISNAVRKYRLTH